MARLGGSSVLGVDHRPLVASVSEGRADPLGEQRLSEQLARRLAERIGDRGPIPVSEYVEACLYDPSGGFYMRDGGGRAGGRSGHFLTAPEVGPLFGAVLARAIDSWWRELGEPEQFAVIDWGAGPGTLARSLLAAEPACAAAGALRLVLVELSPAQRALHPGQPTPSNRSNASARLDASALSNRSAPSSRSDVSARLDMSALSSLPFRSNWPDQPTKLSSSGCQPPVSVAAVSDALPGALAQLAPAGVVLANELLDNLPFDIARRTADGWEELRVTVGDQPGRFALVAVPAPDELVAALPPQLEAGARVPVQRAARRWVAEAHLLLAEGRIVAFDYGASTAALAGRSGPPSDDDPGAGLGWLRTHRDHRGGVSWLTHPGSCDITVDLALDQVQADHRAAVCDQAEFLRAHGIDDLVAAAREAWSARSRVGDLDALKARSRVSEAEALLDPDGMGGFRVLNWTVGG